MHYYVIVYHILQSFLIAMDELLVFVSDSYTKSIYQLYEILLNDLFNLTKYI